MDTRDLFISHASEDEAPARELRAALEAAGYTCWMAPDDVVGNNPWAEQILQAIETTRVMIVLISRSANDSIHVSREVNLALAHGRPILPIRVEGVAPGGALEYLLSLVQRVDAFPPPVADHMPRVRRMVDSLLQTAPVATAPTLDATEPVPLPLPAPPLPAPPLPHDIRSTPAPLPRAGPLAPGASAWVRANRVLVAVGAVAVVAIVVAAIAIGSRGPGPSPTPSSAAVASASPSASLSSSPSPTPPGPPAAPADLKATATAPTTIDLTWAHAAPAAVTSYEIYRATNLVRVLPGDAASYRDLGVAPATSYEYAIIAVGPGGRSTRATASATTAGLPPTGDARVAGRWNVTMKATSSDATDVKVGDTRTDAWIFTPSCPIGPCDIAGVGYFGWTDAFPMTRSDADYSATFQHVWTDPKCGTNTAEVDISITGVEAGFDILGTQLTGRLTGKATENAHSTCGSATVEWDLSGTAFREPLTGVLNAGLQCQSSPLPTGDYWKGAVAVATCTATAGQKAYFYQYLYASAAEADYRTFVAKVDGPVTSCGDAHPAPGIGLWGGTGSTTNAGDVACGYGADGKASEERIYVWTEWDAALVGYGDWPSGTALRDFWETPSNWLAKP